MRKRRDLIPAGKVERGERKRTADEVSKADYYAHITTLRCDPVNPPLLGMAKVVLNPRNLRSSGRATALFASLTMPFAAYQDIAADDMAALIAYLRSLPTVE